MSLGVFLYICAFVCFILEVIGIKASINLVALGLAFWVLVGIVNAPWRRVA
jgi:hypothetical protein